MSETHRAAIIIVALGAGWGTPAPAQELDLSASGQLGLAVVNREFGGAIGLGPRLVWGRLVTAATADLTVVPHLEDRYDWNLTTDGSRLCQDPSGRTVSSSECLRESVYWGVLLDAALVMGAGPSVRPILGAGYRLGDASTPFVSLGATGRLGSGFPWHVRLMAGDRFVQLHYGMAAGRPVR